MTPVDEGPAWGQARLALEVLLDEQPGRAAATTPDWSILLPLAQDNAILLRLGERADRGLGPLPGPVAAGCAHERQRVAAALAVAHTVSGNAAAAGIPILFPKALQHYPDLGRDLDLVTLADPPDDARLLSGVPAEPRPGSWLARLAGTRLYHVRDPDLELDIQHGAVGVAGQHAAVARHLVENRRVSAIADHALAVPSPEDQLVLQGIQKVLGRRSFRIADAVHTLRAIREGQLDWPGMVAFARRAGAWHALSCYLAYVDQIHRRAFGRAVLDGPMRSHLASRDWGQVGFRQGRFRFPAGRAHVQLYLTELVSAVRRRDMVAGARLVAYAPLAAATALRRVAS